MRGYWAAGVRHIVALRGDPPTGVGTRYEPHPGGYANAADLVAGLKRIGDFEISVGGYPEKHPESASLEADLDNLKAKVDAGANRIITQFFFDNAHYLRFLERGARARHLGADHPGHRADPQLQAGGELRRPRPARRCRRGWRAASTGSTTIRQTTHLVAAAVAAEQVMDLVDQGIRQFHFYTLNRADLVYAICHLLGLRPRSDRSLPKAVNA